GSDAGPHGCLDRSRGEGVRVHPMRCAGLGHPAHHAVDCRLRGHVGRPGSNPPILRGYGAGRQNLAVSLLAHNGEELARGVHHAHHVDVEQRLPFFVRAFGQRGSCNRACAQHENVDLAVLSQYSVDHRIGLLNRGHIILTVFNARANVLVFRAVSRHHGGACASESLRNALAHSTCPSGDQCHLACQICWSAQMLCHRLVSPLLLLLHCYCGLRLLNVCQRNPAVADMASSPFGPRAQSDRVPSPAGLPSRRKGRFTNKGDTPLKSKRASARPSPCCSASCCSSVAVSGPWTTKSG